MGDHARFRRRVRRAAAVFTAAVVAAVAAPAIAATPPGQGLVQLPSPITCEGIGQVTVTTIPGGPPGTGPAWILSTGAMMLVQEITITQAGAPVFHKDYGNKAGLGSTTTCTAALPGGLTLEAELVTVR
jgi:hypothetical protein